MICICICFGSPYCYGCNHSRCDSKPESTRGFPAFVIPAAWSGSKMQGFSTVSSIVFSLSAASQLEFVLPYSLIFMLPHSLNLCCLTAWCKSWFIFELLVAPTEAGYVFWNYSLPTLVLRYWFSGVGRIFVLNSVGYLHQWIGCSGGDRISSWISLSTSTLHLSALAQMQFHFDPSFSYRSTTQHLYAHAQMRYDDNSTMDSDFGLREWRIQVWLATHPSAACPDVSLADKAAGRPQQITDHPEWDVLCVERKLNFIIVKCKYKIYKMIFHNKNTNKHFLYKNWK